jgi:hypothetical protein
MTPATDAPIAATASTSAAVVIGRLAAQQAGRPDLIRAPTPALART